MGIGGRKPFSTLPSLGCKIVIARKGFMCWYYMAKGSRVLEKVGKRVSPLDAAKYMVREWGELGEGVEIRERG